MAVKDSQNPGQTVMGAAFATAGVGAGSAPPPAGGGGGGGSQQPPIGGGGQGPTPGPQGNPRAFSFRTLGQFVNSPMGRTPASEVLSKLEKALRTVYENINNQFEIDVIPLDMGQNTVLTVSCLVVAARLKANRDAGVAYHTLILEGSTEPPAPKFVPINGQQTEVLVTMGEANNDRLREVVADMMSKTYPQLRTWLADACVVPRDFDVSNETAVYLLAANAAFACSVELDNRRQDFEDLNLSNASKDDSLTVRTGFPKNQVLNAVGHPVRQDITIDLQAAPAGQQQNQQLMERTATVARISGFLDLVWSPVMPTPNQFNPFPAGQQQGQQQDFYKKYIPRLVMTGMESTAAPTLGCQLLTLVMAAALAENNQWVYAFRSPAYGGSQDMHDIGAVGIEANFDNNPNGIGSRINTKDDSFKQQDLGRLVAAVMKPSLIISLDVEECGPSTWINGVFAYAASGHQGANRAILQAADRLTNGAFARLFPAGGRVCINEDNRIHLGYYYDGEVRKDLRDVDYLAVLNLIGERDPDIVRDWSDTFQQIQFPLEQRLAARKRIISAAAPSAVYTGFAHRVTFESAFIQALIDGCREVGLDVKSIQPYQDQGSYDRATAAFAGQTMFSTQNTGLFNRGGVYGTNTVNPGARAFGGGRWYP